MVVDHNDELRRFSVNEKQTPTASKTHGGSPTAGDERIPSTKRKNDVFPARPACLAAVVYLGHALQHGL